MSDIRMHFTAFDGPCRIILAGINETDSKAAMMNHVFNCLGKEFRAIPEFSESDNLSSDIVVISSIAPPGHIAPSDFNNSVSLLRKLTGSIAEGGTLVYYHDDEALRDIANESRADIRKMPYKMHGYFQNKLGIFAATHNRTVHVTFAGDENMQSLSAVREVCLAAGLSEDDFYEAIASYK